MSNYNKMKKSKLIEIIGKLTEENEKLTEENEKLYKIKYELKDKIEELNEEIMIERQNYHTLSSISQKLCLIGMNQYDD